MSAGDLARLVLLAALWGSAFLFMRIAAPSLGAILTAELRVIVAGTLLAAYAVWMKERLQLVANWQAYFLIGAIGSALPFALYAYASMHVPAGLNAIINATSPLYGAIAAAVLLGDPLTQRRVLAIGTGAIGVWVLAGDFSALSSPSWGWALAAGLGAGLCYGLAGVMTKRIGRNLSPLAWAAGTQLAAGVILAPLLPAMQPPGPITWAAIAAAVALAILASVIGYVMYFRLLASIGPVKTLLVTFLIPVFGVLWGAIFLDERVGPSALVGGALILFAVWLETRRSARAVGLSTRS